jgi:hypothetical protein
MKRSIAFLGAFLLAAGTAFAAPMGFKGSWMLMGDFSSNWREASANYALTAQDALGGAAVYMRSDDKTKTRSLAEVNYTRLLNRWNLANAQANVWFYAGLGSMSGNNLSGSRATLSPGMQVDYETTRIYLAAAARLYQGDQVKYAATSARAGFSFKEATYEEIQPWAVLEVRRTSNLSDKTEVTPMLRLIHKRFFVELGVNNSSQGRANFMYTY